MWLRLGGGQVMMDVDREICPYASSQYKEWGRRSGDGMGTLPTCCLNRWRKTLWVSKRKYGLQTINSPVSSHRAVAMPASNYMMNRVPEEDGGGGGGGGGATQERTAWKQMRTPVPWFAGHLSILVPVGKWGTTDKLGTLEPVVDWLHWVMPHQNEFEPKQISSHWATLRHKAQGSEASSQSLDTNLACSLLPACWTSSSGHTHLLIPTQPATKGLQPKHPCTQTK